jgi:hypothetical protein
MWNVRRDLSFVVSMAQRIHGQLNVDVLRRSLQEVVRRHESLRTRIVLRDGVPVQEISSAMKRSLGTIELALGSRLEREQAAQQAVEAIFGEKVNVEEDPLFQTYLLEISDGDHVLAIRFHHIITDGTSVEIVLRELWALYRDFASGQLSSLPEVRVQYSDYALWQRKTLGESWRQETGRYWRAKLSKGRHLDFPACDKSSGEIESGSAAPLHLSLDEALSASLRELAHAQKIPLSVLVLAICTAVLSRWCEQREIEFVTLATGRDLPRFAAVTGYLAHALHLNMALSGGETFIDLLRAVTKEFLTAWEHGIAPERVPEARDTRQQRPVVFQWLSWGSSLFSEIHHVCPEDCNTRLTVEPFPVRKLAGFHGRTPAALLLNFFDTEHGICGAGHYSSDMFKPDSMTKFLINFRRFAESIVRSPEASVETLQY